MFPLSMLRTHGRLLGFGFFMCLCSNFGQTFFISLFSGEVRAEFGLTHGGFGTIYSVATLGSAALLVWSGRLVDRMGLPLYSAIILFGLSGACLVFGLAGGEVALVVAILFLRQLGQGLANHTGITVMGRYFDSHRGRAVALATMGHPAGEAVFPILVVLALSVYGWREIWITNAIIVVLAVPVMLLFLAGHEERHAAHVSARDESGAAVRDRTLKQAIRGSALWIRMPALLAPSFISTGLIFHQVHLAEVKGWSLTLLSGSFSAYAALSVVAVVVGGPLVDRIGARRLTTIFLAPLALSALSVAVLDGAWGAPVFLGLLGASAGLTSVIFGALWAELYGISHLGAIRAFGQAAMVFSSGVAPVVLGILIDQGIGIEAVAAACSAYCVIASILARDVDAGTATEVTRG
jgi:MFS family permease